MGIEAVHRALILLLSMSVCHSAPAIILSPVKNPDDFGASLQYKNQDSIGNYNFGYNEGHVSGGSFRREAGDASGSVAGSYGLRDADGRLRIVSYIADANGFRAKVDTNEPGVEPQDPASAIFNKPAILTTRPLQPVVAPQVLPPLPAPVGLVPPPLAGPFPVALPVGIPPPTGKFPVALPVGIPPPTGKFPVSLPIVPQPLSGKFPVPIPVLPPPPPAPAVIVPSFPKAIEPYVNAVLPVKRSSPVEYYGAPYFNRVIPAPVIRPGIPPLSQVKVNSLTYEFPSKKNLSSFQPLGFS